MRTKLSVTQCRVIASSTWGGIEEVLKMTCSNGQTSLCSFACYLSVECLPIFLLWFSFSLFFGETIPSVTAYLPKNGSHFKATKFRKLSLTVAIAFFEKEATKYEKQNKITLVLARASERRYSDIPRWVFSRRRRCCNITKNKKKASVVPNRRSAWSQQLQGSGITQYQNPEAKIP